MRTLAQRRAENALQWVRKHEKDISRMQYRSYVDRLPAMIVMNGLGQAVAMELAAAGPDSRKRSADEEAHFILYEGLQQWLCGEDGVYEGKSKLIDAIVESSQKEYVIAQAEALAWLDWHKKFCRALLPRSEG